MIIRTCRLKQEMATPGEKYRWVLSLKKKRDDEGTAKELMGVRQVIARVGL